MEDGFAYMAMADYPYANDFLMKLPAWPVNVSCSKFDTAVDPKLINYDEFKAAVDIYY